MMGELVEPGKLVDLTIRATDRSDDLIKYDTHNI